MRVLPPNKLCMQISISESSLGGFNLWLLGWHHDRYGNKYKKISHLQLSKPVSQGKRRPGFCSMYKQSKNCFMLRKFSIWYKNTEDQGMDYWHMEVSNEDTLGNTIEDNFLLSALYLPSGRWDKYWIATWERQTCLSRTFPEGQNSLLRLYGKSSENPRQAQNAINVNTHKKPIYQYERSPSFWELLETKSEVQMVWL